MLRVRAGRVLAALVWLGLAGCGQMGPLTLPDAAAAQSAGTGQTAASDDGDGGGDER
jgi:predicted small lipoprotein YifL